jgi:hypothetical protein
MPVFAPAVSPHSVTSDEPVTPTVNDISTLEITHMTRSTGHTAAYPYRLTRAAVEAHREHLPTPFLGCPLCARRTAITPLRIRWTAPRQA